MNIFYLHKSPSFAASMHCDKHVVKMILESAQMLCTAHRVLDGAITTQVSRTGRKLKTWTLPDERDVCLYKSAHVNHPSSKWVRESDKNYHWLLTLLDGLCLEYTHRYKKHHKVESSKLIDLLYYLPDNIPFVDETQIPQCMPDEFKVENDPVSGYRKYYYGHKHDMKKWNNGTPPPDWWTEMKATT